MRKHKLKKVLSAILAIVLVISSAFLGVPDVASADSPYTLNASKAEISEGENVTFTSDAPETYMAELYLDGKEVQRGTVAYYTSTVLKFNIPWDFAGVSSIADPRDTTKDQIVTLRIYDVVNGQDAILAGEHKVWSDPYLNSVSVTLKSNQTSLSASKDAISDGESVSFTATNASSLTMAIFLENTLVLIGPVSYLEEGGSFASIPWDYYWGNGMGRDTAKDQTLTCRLYAEGVGGEPSWSDAYLKQAQVTLKAKQPINLSADKTEIKAGESVKFTTTDNQPDLLAELYLDGIEYGRGTVADYTNTGEYGTIPWELMTHNKYPSDRILTLRVYGIVSSTHKIWDDSTDLINSVSVTLKAYQAPSTDATLSGLSLSTGTLSPAFASDTNNYTASVSNATTSIKVTPVVNESNATVTVNGSSVTANSASGDISLNVGDNTIPVVVTAQDGETVNTYNITVKRAANYTSNASKTEIGEGESVSFSTNADAEQMVALFYDETLIGRGLVGDNSEADCWYTPFPWYNSDYTDGRDTSKDQTLTFRVYANTNIQNVYPEWNDTYLTQVSVTLKAKQTISTDASLSGLSLSTGTLSPTFASDTYNYTASVSNATTSVKVTPVANNSNATVKVGGSIITAGSASGDISLNVGNNTIPVVVIAQDEKTVHTYNITVNRATADSGDPIVRYVFNGDLIDTMGTGYSLTNLYPDENKYATEIVGGTSKQVLTFGKKGGLKLENLDKILSNKGDYTIDLIARISATSHYSKILDFKNRTSDDGLYMYKDNTITFYPNSSSTLIKDGEYTRIALTRSSATNKMNVYINGVKQMTIDDSTGKGTISADNILYFFTDDTNVTDDNEGGAVSLIRIFNYPFSDSDMEKLVMPTNTTPETDSSAYMKYITNINTDAASDSGSSAYDIRGCVDGSHWLSTTYDDGGFGTFLKVGTNLQGLTNISNGVEKSIDSLNLAVTQNLSFVRGGKFVKVQYIVRNTSNQEQTVSLCSGADVQIGNNDDAPVTAFADGTGFYMTGDNAQFNFIGKGAPEVTDVDAFWFGDFEEFNNHNALFTQTNAASYNGDSGMCYSWNNRTIPAGGSQTFSVLIGIGAPNALPVLTVSTPSSNFSDSYVGGSVSFGGTVTDSENSTGTELYYKIDDRTPVKAYTFAGTPGTFTANIAIPSDLSVGTHTIKLYAQDLDGGISTLITKTIKIQAPNNAVSAPIAVPSESKDEQIVVDVKQGESDKTASQIVINRSTDTSGSKTDTVTYAADKARDTVSKLKESGESTARIVIPDNSSAVSKTTVNIPTDTLSTLSDSKVALQIDTGVAKIDLPKDSVTNASSKANGNLYFNLVPVKQEEQKSELMERAKTQVTIVNKDEQDTVSVVGVPVTIETNMPSSAVDITLPLTGVTIPSDSTEKEAFLKQLGVYIEHSDGTKELVQGEIVTYANGVQGIKFHITKFSTFTIVKIDNKQTAEATPIVVQKGFSPLLLQAKADATTQTLSYQKVSGADGYILYGAPCGKDKHMMIIKTLTADTTSYSVTGQAINTYYKYQVKAYQLINGKKVIIAVSKLIHSTTTSKIYTNPSKITCDTSALTLKIGNTKALKCNVVSTKGKTVAKHTDVLRYESTSTAIATVDNKGMITAKAKGTCYIFAYAQNGVYKKIKVTVE